MTPLRIRKVFFHAFSFGHSFSGLKKLDNFAPGLLRYRDVYSCDPVQSSRPWRDKLVSGSKSFSYYVKFCLSQRKDFSKFELCQKKDFVVQTVIGREINDRRRRRPVGVDKSWRVKMKDDLTKKFLDPQSVTDLELRGLSMGLVRQVTGDEFVINGDCVEIDNRQSRRRPKKGND